MTKSSSVNVGNSSSSNSGSSGKIIGFHVDVQRLAFRVQPKRHLRQEIPMVLEPAGRFDNVIADVALVGSIMTPSSCPNLPSVGLRTGMCPKLPIGVPTLPLRGDVVSIRSPWFDKKQRGCQPFVAKTRQFAGNAAVPLTLQLPRSPEPRGPLFRRRPFLNPPGGHEVESGQSRKLFYFRPSTRRRGRKVDLCGEPRPPRSARHRRHGCRAELETEVDRSVIRITDTIGILTRAK